MWNCGFVLFSKYPDPTLQDKRNTDLDLNLMIFIIRKLGRIRCWDEKNYPYETILMKHILFPINIPFMYGY